MISSSSTNSAICRSAQPGGQLLFHLISKLYENTSLLITTNLAFADWPQVFGDAPVTNIRNLKSPHWRGWLGKNRRCVVPETSFCEYADTKPRKTPTWFALSEDRPLFAFGGVRGPKSAPVEGNHELFGFLTTEANAVVAPIHPKAMPVILTSPAEADRWLEAETADALALQRPLPEDALRIVAKGEKEDAPPQS